MKLKFVREILKHYEGHEYDDWDLVLWDYNNQREVKWSEGMYAASKDDKKISFPVEIEPVDGVQIEERIKKLYENIKNNGTEKN